MKRDIKLLMKNKNFIMLLLHYSIYYGIYTCLGAIINNLVSFYGFGAKSSSLFGATFILAGVVASFVVSTMIDRNKKFLLAYRLLSVFALIFGACIGLSLPSRKVFWVNLNIALLGAVLVPIVPLGFSFSVELTHPVSEAMSNGVIVLAAQLVGFFMTYLGTWLADQQPLYCVALFGVLMLIGLVFAAFIKEDLRRVALSIGSAPGDLPAKGGSIGKKPEGSAAEEPENGIDTNNKE